MMRIATVLLSVAFLPAGCLPIPMIPHGLGVVLDQEDFEALKPGEVSRSDILMNLGEPRYRIEADRFLMYEWTVAYGYVIIGGAYQAYPVPVTAPHYLCLEFTEDAMLLRREHLTGSFFAEPDKAIRKCQGQPEES